MDALQLSLIKSQRKKSTAKIQLDKKKKKKKRKEVADGRIRREKGGRGDRFDREREEKL